MLGGALPLLRFVSAVAGVFDSVEVVEYHFHPWGMAEENRDILVCRGLKMPLTELLPRLKRWN